MNKFAMLGIAALTVVLVGAGCTAVASPSLSIEEQVAQNQAELEAKVGLPDIDNSLDRINVSKRLELFDDPNKVSYIYLTDYGRVMSFYTIKGKVTSSNKRLTTNEQLVGCDTGEWNGECIVEAPSLDGTYGSSDAYVFFWTTDGVYVQWSGDYMLVDEPLSLTSQPELVRSIE